jgi:hypothetical protein
MTDNKTTGKNHLYRKSTWFMATAALAFIMFATYLHILLEKNTKTAPVCPAEGRQLTDRELVDTFLFGPEGRTMTNAQKTDRLKKEKNGVYPDCCRVTGRYLYGQPYDLIDDLAGDFIFEIETNFPDLDPVEKKYPYQIWWSSINRCGTGGGYDAYGDNIEKKDYEYNLEMNRKYWEGKRK